jgi:hypothetical protein
MPQQSAAVQKKKQKKQIVSDDESECEWVVKPGAVGFVCDKEDDDSPPVVYRIQVVCETKEDDDGEIQWSVAFADGSHYDYPESLIFQTEREANVE